MTLSNEAGQQAAEPRGKISSSTFCGDDLFCDLFCDVTTKSLYFMLGIACVALLEPLFVQLNNVRCEFTLLKIFAWLSLLSSSCVRTTLFAVGIHCVWRTPLLIVHTRTSCSFCRLPNFSYLGCSDWRRVLHSSWQYSAGWPESHHFVVSNYSFLPTLIEE